MRGGEALTRLHSAGGLCVATMDQNNALTEVSAPEWMWPWSATPAVRAFEVWPLQRAALEPASLLHPCYRRLAMGGSHSVYILMGINLFQVGKALAGRRALQLQADALESDKVSTLERAASRLVDSIGERCLEEIPLEDASSWLARAAAMLGAP